MKFYQFLFSIFLIGLISSCTQQDQNSKTEEIRSAFKIDLNPSYLQPTRIDSIPLASTSDFIFDRVPELNPDLFKRNKQFVVSRPNVIMGLMDTTGTFLQKITEKGVGPGELLAARSAKGWIGEDGDIYVLTNANAYALYVFTRDAEFKYMIKLFSTIDGIYHPRSGFYHMSEKRNGVYKLTLSIGSTLYSTFNNEHYERSDAIAQFIIDDRQEKVIKASTKLPLKQYEEIKRGLDDRSISWGGREAIFREYNGQFFLTFPFSKVVYVYNQEFEEIDRISLQTLHLYDPGFSYPMQTTPEQLYDRTYLEFRAYLENSFIKNIQIMNDLLIIQYQAPLKESEYLHRFPTKKDIQTKDNWEDFFIKVDQTWLIHDLKTKKEKLIRLPKDHDLATFLDERRLLIMKEIKGVEDPYIFKYYLKEPLSNFQ
ncbi:MAG: hypothetical protein Roseis2KO_24280 [Roseivirga sp.]